MKGVKALHLNSFHFLQVSDLSAMVSFYGLLETTLSRSSESPESIHAVYTQLHTLQVAFPTLIKLLKIALTLAVSNAQCERTFQH